MGLGHQALLLGLVRNLYTFFTVLMTWWLQVPAFEKTPAWGGPEAAKDFGRRPNAFGHPCADVHLCAHIHPCAFICTHKRSCAYECLRRT